MSRYIDADLLWDKISRVYSFSDRRGIMGYVSKCLNESPTADVEPVRHGRWIIDSGCGEYEKCSECEGKSGTQYDGVEPIPLLTAYCPHCGAKMDGGDK